MRPRKFYIGFPPPLVRVRRRGIEYGIGTIPLGGYVKIPGMHRPAARDLDYRLQHAITSAPELVKPVEAVKRPLARADYEEASVALDDLELALRAANQPTEVLTDVRDALAPDAYWRQRVWKKVLVIFAGPGANLLFAILVFAILFMIGGGKATSTVDDVLEELAGRAHGRAGRRSDPRDRRAADPTSQRTSRESSRDRGGDAVTLRRQARRPDCDARPHAAREDERRLPARLRAQGGGPFRARGAEGIRAADGARLP